MTTAISWSWPAAYQRVISNQLANATGNVHRRILRTINQYSAWSEESFPAMSVLLDVDRWHAFRNHLGLSLSEAVTKQRMRVLYDLGISGPDKFLRDWLFDNGIDRRSVKDITEAPWWPMKFRLLAQDLNILCNRRILLQVDAYLRCVDRLGSLPIDPISHLFLAENITDRTRYHRLSRLCVGLELLAPGDRQLVPLRMAQSDLYSRVWPPKPASAAPKREIREIEALLTIGTNAKTGKPWAEATIANRRKALVLYHDLLANHGLPLAFDKASLDVFADNALDRHEAWLVSKGEKGWCRRSVAGYCERLSPFIDDPAERKKWTKFANRFTTLARKNGDPKAKERALCERPMSLEDYFRRANKLISLAEDTMDVQARYGMLTVVGTLGILLVLPLRSADLRRLVIGVHLLRDPSG